MSGRLRSLPARPSLRYLKLEARRRLSAGEFRTLHDAHRAIAREYGQPSWTSLKQLIDSQIQQDSHALAQLRWIIDRFRDAGTPGWTAPEDHEMRQHFDDRILAAIPPADLVADITGMAADLGGEVVVLSQAPLLARVQIAGLEYVASADAQPPHRLTGLRGHPLAGRITDPRAAAPPPGQTFGQVPAEAAQLCARARAERGLVGLALAGGGPRTPAWLATQGWADLDRAEALDARHRFPAMGVTALVTVTAVLRLIADGRLGLDTPANEPLLSVRLADDTVTVRELLSQTAGVGSPAPAQLFGDSVPDLAALTGPVIRCSGERGAVQPSNGGYGVLGQLVADITGSTYPDAVTRLVLQPLGMSGSFFPGSRADLGPDVITGYSVTRDGIYQQVPDPICTIPAAGGLWATAADIVRLGTAWSSLLPPTLAREALTPQTVPDPAGGRVGLGWLIRPGGEVAMHAGTGPAGTASILLRIRDGDVRVIMTTMSAPLDIIDDSVLNSWTSSAPAREE